jgi:hypothetical protein
MKTSLFALAAYASLEAVATAAPARVAVLGPAVARGASIVPRLEEAIEAMGLAVATGPATACTREAVAAAMSELECDAAVCADGDTVSAWMKEGNRLVLRDVVIGGGEADPDLEGTAARSTSVFVGAPRERPWTAEAPRFGIGAGFGVTSSRDGSSLALSLEGQIGVGRQLALVPWLDFVPTHRTAAGAEGTATFRPTIFGLGIAVPLAPTSSLVIPRVGAGGGVLWMHVSPASASATAVMREPEDLLAPIAYVSAAASLRVVRELRIVGACFAGVASSEMVIRIANEPTSRWGVPLTGADLRLEWVVP